MYLEITETLKDLNFDINVLLEDNLLSHFGLNLIAMELTNSLGM